MSFADLSSAKSWRREKASDAGVFRTSTGLSVSVHKLKAPASTGDIAGARLLFISDLHIRAETTWSLAPFRGGLLSWRGLDWIEASITEAVAFSKPDFLVFGGDLAVHSCWLEKSIAMLGSLASGIPKVAVYGNWDKRRRRWLPHAVWEDLYSKAGFKLLVNQSWRAGPFRFYGLDDFKMGIPSYQRPSPSDARLFNCVISHNPDGIMRSLSGDDISGIDLLLCGHTHGGQWRIPLLGAFETSSRHWKCFELGMYKHASSKARMLVSAGIGATAINARLNCPPEVSLIEFI